MPIYCYTCKHESKELLQLTPSTERCPLGCTMSRDYHAERAGFPPFIAYDTEAFAGGITHITTRDQERKLEKQTGFVRVS